MEKLQLTEYFEYNYLLPGHTRDNFVIYGCPKEVISLAEQSLSNETEEVKPCLIKITREIEEPLEKIFSFCKNEIQQKIIARSFLVAMCLNKLGDESQNELLNAILSGSEEVLNMSGEFPLPMDLYHKIKVMERETGKKFEMNILLDGNKNILLQQVVNNYLTSREPYSIKVFTTADKLITNFDQCNNWAQAIHDYLSVRFKDYVKKPPTCEEELI